MKKNELNQSQSLQLIDLIQSVTRVWALETNTVDASRIIADLIAKVLQAEIVYLSILSQDHRHLILLSSVGLQIDLLEERINLPLASNSITALAASTQEIIQVANLDVPSMNEYFLTKKLRRFGIQSFIAVPLVVAGVTVGVLSLGRKKSGTLSPSEMQILQSVSNSCAVCLQQARLRESEKKITEELQSVRSAMQAIGEGKALPQLLKNIVHKSVELTGARYAAIGILNTQKNGLSDFVTAGLSDEIKNKIGHPPSGKGLLGALIKEKKTIRVARVSEDPRFAGFPLHHPPMKSFLGVPIKIRDEIIGNLYVSDKLDGTEFSLEDEKKLELFSTHAAPLVDYANKIEQQKKFEQLRKEFIEVIAHDLRNPIQAIQLQAEIFWKKAKEKECIEMPKSSLDLFCKSSQLLARLTQDLLDASRIESTRLEIKPKTIHLTEEINLILDHIKLTLSPRPLNVKIENNLHSLCVDPERLHQIVNNLTENAAKYSAPNTPVELSIKTQDDGVLFSVTDHGTGIPKEDIPFIFDRFFRVKTVRDKKNGLGLGLYITRGLVEAHGGKIWVHSQVGKGSTFYVWFPAAEQFENMKQKAA